MNPEPRPHKYDRQLSPKDFLLAVMRDPTVPLELRIDAAGKALSVHLPDPDLRDSGVTYRIPELPLQ